MITLNNIKSQIVYYCKNWFKDRSDCFTDLRMLTAQWAGIEGPSNEVDCTIILMEILKKLNVRPDCWQNIIQAMVAGIWYRSDVGSPFHRFVMKFMEIVGHMEVSKNGETLISLEPLDLTIFDKRN